MAWTQDDLDTIEAAIKTGARRVKFKDSEIEYQSLAEMRSTRNEMRRELGITVKTRRRAPSYSKGLDSCE